MVAAVDEFEQRVMPDVAAATGDIADSLNLLTGETGSGKSIVVDSLGLLFGGRAAADMVRTGAERARVAGIFDLPSSKPLSALLLIFLCVKYNRYLMITSLITFSPKASFTLCLMVSF